MRISDWSSDVCSSDLQPCRVLDFGRRGIRLAVGDVVVDRIVEQNRVLRDDADRLAQALLRYRADILSIDADGACVDVVEPEQDKIGRASCRERVRQYV